MTIARVVITLMYYLAHCKRPWILEYFVLVKIVIGVRSALFIGDGSVVFDECVTAGLGVNY